MDERAALPGAVDGQSLRMMGPVGALNVYRAGSGKPLLLIHSVNAAASAAEVRPLQEHYVKTRTVYCLELPGYGLSDRPDVAYSPRIMTDAIKVTLREIQRLTGEQSIDTLALSLSSEYLARAAGELPGTVRSIALVSPTGFKNNVVRRGAPGSTLEISWLYALLRGPGWGRGLFQLLTRPAVIRYFLEKTWGSKHIDDALLRYDIQTTRQIGAEHAPLRFLSGCLFSRDIHTVYEAIGVPIWLSHGVRGDFTDYGGKSMFAGRSNWSFTVYPTGALPHFEMTAAFCVDYDAFLQG